MATKTSDWRPGPTVCRCCLAEGCYKDISTEYFWMGKREVYAEMLSETMNVTIAYSKSGGPNSNSRLICEPCISRLRDASDFKRQVVECEKTFMNHLDPGSSRIQKEVELHVEPLEEVKIERVKQEKQQSDDDEFEEAQVDFVMENDDDEDDDDLDDEPLMKLATKVPKKELDLQDLLDNTELTVKRKSSAKTKEPPAKKPKKIVIKPSASKASSSAPKTEKKKKGPVTIRWKSDFGDARDNATIILEYSNACPFQFYRNTFFCAYCSYQSPEFGPIRRHTSGHDGKAKAIRRAGHTDIFKADVANLQCKLCRRGMTTLNEMYHHLIEVHKKPIKREFGTGIFPFLLNDGFRCADCGLTFDRFFNLNKHINKHYPNFICSHCGSVFSSSNRYRSHLAVHKKETPTFTCSQCHEVFPTLSAKKKHRMSVHNIFSNNCPYCNESFKQYTQKLQHMNIFHNKNINYPCSMCSNIFKSLSSRAYHVRRVHNTDKNHVCTECGGTFVRATDFKNHMYRHTGERLHKCEVCSKAYTTKKTLTEHMRIHNNDRRFVCGYCTSAFVQSSSLKSHMRTHHSSKEMLRRAKSLKTIDV